MLEFQCPAEKLRLSKGNVKRNLEGAIRKGHYRGRNLYNRCLWQALCTKAYKAQCGMDSGSP
eukprot:1921737-Amphidinium_carterae.1